MKSALIVLLVSMLPALVFAQSTSTNPGLRISPMVQVQEVDGASETITFSEFPSGTSIDTQYQDVGIIFGGSAPFITGDGANPTSPVLSGTPRFQGDITGTFVEPGTNRPTVVQSFTFDAGYFDEIGSTRIEWFDPDGKKLGQRINSLLGIEQLTFEGGNIGSWRIGIVQNEPAGYAIDNVFFTPIGPSVLFREKIEEEKDGSWGLLSDDLPGFDHVGFQMGNLVYESHPGYPSGTYVSADGQESIPISKINGVQFQHSRATFEHDSTSTATSPVIDFEEIPIEEDLAVKMRNSIESVAGLPYPTITFDLAGLLLLSPAAQKGSNGSFTCIGLIEWAAEQAGHNGGEGFIRNRFESFSVVDPRTFPPELIELPLLSPQLLNYAMKGQQLLQKASQWIQGLFDPVDFILTDPLGRKLGFLQSGGVVSEIPYAFYSGDGGIEQFLIPNAIPGTYTLRLVGTGADTFGAIGSENASESFSGFLAQDETSVRQIFVEPKAGTGGDVDGDGDVDDDDIQALLLRLNKFTDGLGDPGDLNGDGLLSDADVDLLTELINVIDKVAPAFISSPPLTVESGALYTYDADAGGIPDPEYFLDEAPIGMTIDQQSGLIEWSADSIGSFAIVVRAVNSAGTDTQSFTITVVPDTFDITALAYGNGAINPPSVTTVPRGGSQEYSFVPDAGYEIEDVKVEGVSIGAPSSYTFTDVQSDQTIEVTFAPDAPTGTILLSDDFNRADNATVGNGWVEVETTGGTVDVNGGRLSFADTSDLTNRPMVSHDFTQVSSGKLIWDFDFDWSRTGNEAVYRVFMQLGDGTLMTTSSKTAGVGVDLVWTEIGGAHEQLGYRHGQNTTAITTVKGLKRITVEVDLDTHTYIVGVDGVAVASGLPFDQNVALDTVRFFTDSLAEQNISGRAFDNVNIRLPAVSNTPPSAEDDSYTMSEGTTLTVSSPGVLGNDTDFDGNPLTVIPMSGVASGTLNLSADGSFSYTPSAGFTGIDSFSYKANDGAADSYTATVTLTVAPATILLSDDFNRVDSGTVGNGWVEMETTGGVVDVSAGRLSFTDTSDLANRPMVSHGFQQVSSGKLVWEFDFDWSRTGSEGIYGLFMQLGDGALMTTESQDAGVGVNLIWTEIGGIHERVGYRQGGNTTEIETVSGPVRISVEADLDRYTYTVAVDGVTLAAGLPFDQNVALDSVRFFTDALAEQNFSGRAFDNVVIRR